MSEVSLTVDGAVALVELHRPPNNFFDESLLLQLGEALGEVDASPTVRCAVLASQGRHFCAGADLRGIDADGLRRVYRAAFGVISTRKPLVAAVHGAAVGGGLGLALAADFRVVAPDARLTANFARLGFHQGFGLSVTLPAAVGRQRALELLYTGRDVPGVEAGEIGLADRVAADPRAAAMAFATEIAQSAPLSLLAIRSTMRRQLVAEVHAALDVEAAAQSALLPSADFAEGVAAAVGKRAPRFTGA